ncbi:tyrosine-type recombinase/integrase [Microvirga massiliensis]|uniref:tyrosine-type recombinase/integrase n=1 Tax=Microvirga massiliensis TaxID=1033741 RepID=UPI0006618A46|nr:tyrosine-type recombinase/integrase [Microvirga massiliensis]
MTEQPWMWPTPIRRPNTRQRVSLRLEDWPEVDRMRWEEATRPADLFDEPASASHLKPRTRKTLIDGYGRWLGYLTATDPTLLDLPPGERVTRERIEAFCRALAETNTAKSGAAILFRVRQVLLRLAPEVDWSWLHTIAKRIDAAAQPRSKAANLRMSDELYQLGFDLMDEAAEAAPEPKKVRTKDAITYRDGLMIALLAADPVRRSNFAALTLERTLVRSGTAWTIVLSEAETKGGRPLEYPVPSKIGKRIDQYLRRYRPVIYRSQSHQGVWASAKGCPMNGGAIYDAICRRTRAAFGKPVWLHLFRSAAATFWSVECPEAVLGSKDLLGHQRFGTTDAHYIHARTIQAGRHYTKILEAKVEAARLSHSTAPNFRVSRTSKSFISKPRGVRQQV